MTALVWRKEPPDKDGWWWLRGTIFMTHVLVRDGEIVMGQDQLVNPKKLEGDYEWAGPIPEPKEAK